MDEEQHQKISEYIGKNVGEDQIALASLLTIQSTPLRELLRELKSNPKLHKTMIKAHILSILLGECSIDEALGILEKVREGLIKTDKMFNEVK